MRALVALAAALVAVGLLAAGCGGSADQAAPSTTEAPEAVSTVAATTTAPATTEAPAATTQAPAIEDEPAPTEQAATEAAAKPLPGLPAFTAGYDRWPRLNARPIPPNPDGDAHLGTKNVYVSEPAGPDGVYPEGTIIVKDATRPDADFLGLVAVMRKEAGADPAHNDWVFVEWTRDSAGARFEITARDDVCWSCHMGAVQTDYVWIETLGLAK